MVRTRSMLVILDGFGYSTETQHNPLATARMPFWRDAWKRFPHAVLDASGEDVGLPVGQIGNSEVGHMTIGAGRIIDTDLVRITKAIRSPDFVENPAVRQLFAHVRKHDSFLHLVGLVSPGGVHSHTEHVKGLAQVAYAAGIRKIVVHAFSDGRDTPPQSSVEYLLDLEDFLEKLGVGRIGSVSGRYFGMDRDKNWERIALAEDAIFRGKGKKFRAAKPSEVVAGFHASGVLDEYLEPLVFSDDEDRVYSLGEHDGVLFANFRADRARQLSQRIASCSKELNLCFSTLTEYDRDVEALVVFRPLFPETTLAQEVARAGYTQAHIAETEKYAHVTYFFNGGKEDVLPGEERILIPSRKDVATHDLAPDMRAREITDATIAQMKKGKDFLVVNYANADIVGHTANWGAVVRAVEVLDEELRRLVGAAQEQGVSVLITADHGNAETNVDALTGHKHTAHTMNLVPCVLTDARLALRESGGLFDIAPTLLQMLGLPVPACMTGKSLFV